MEQQFIWVVAFIIGILGFVLIEAQVDNGQVHQNFQSLFDSIARRGSNQSEMYREILKEEVLNETNAFDTKKNELRIARRNSNGKMNSYGRIYEGNMVANKRAAVGNNRDTGESFSQATTQALPGGDETWARIRISNKVYVDKSVYLMKLLEKDHRLRFVTRPRRFGKSMFVDMMEDFFMGKKELFTGLAIANEGNVKYLAPYMKKSRGRVPKWKEFPVIHLNFGELEDFKSIENFEKNYLKLLKEAVARYNLDFNAEALSSYSTRTVIIALSEKFPGLPIIVLVDEYDFPFQHALLQLKDRKIAEEVKNYLDGIFRVIKNCKYVHFAFVVGVWRLGLMALESGGSGAFVDMTHSEVLAEAFGLTEEEIRGDQLRPHLKGLAKATCEGKKEMTPEDQALQELRDWYDGYCFFYPDSRQQCTRRVLNPISTFDSLRFKECRNYWASTGSMDHLVEKFYEDRQFWRLEDLEKGILFPRKDLTRIFDPLNVEPSLPMYMLLFGYATIASYDGKTDQVLIRTPNKEIREAIRYRLEEYVPSKRKFLNDCREEIKKISVAMNSGNLQWSMKLLREYDFIPISHPSADGVTAQEIQRRIGKLFYDARITYQEGVKFKKDQDPNQDGGDIDFLTMNLEMNYAISLKCKLKSGFKGKKGNALEAIEQMIDYIKESPTNFQEAIKKLNVDPENIYIVGISFTGEDEGQLNQWISVPRREGKLVYEAVETDSDELKEKFLNKYAPNNLAHL